MRYSITQSSDLVRIHFLQLKDLFEIKSLIEKELNYTFDEESSVVTQNKGGYLLIENVFFENNQDAINLYLKKVQDSKIKVLYDKDLFKIIDKEFDKKIEKEYESRKAIFFTSCMSLVNNCAPTSSNLIVNSISGTGKDHVAKNTLAIWNKEKLVKRTRISPTVFTYWRQGQDWDGIICYLEDISNGVLNHDVFKVMSSGGSHATVTINQKAVDIEIKGKPVIIVTTASANPNQETLRRFPIVNVDDSKDQTKAVVKKKLEWAMTGKSQEFDSNISFSLSKLVRVNVKIPFAHKLFESLPYDNVIIRTNIDRLLDLIKASCALHQFQRKKDKDKFLLAEEQDYNYAREIVNSLSANSSTIPLTKDQQKIIGIFESINNEWNFINDIADKVNFMSDRYLRTHLDNLTRYEILSRKHEKVETSSRPKLMYKLNTTSKFELPEYCRICSNSTFNTNSSISSISSIKDFYGMNKPYLFYLNYLNSYFDPLNCNKSLSYQEIKSLFQEKKKIRVSYFGRFEDSITITDMLNKLKTEGFISEIKPGILEVVQ